MEENTHVSHGFYITDEFNNKTEVNKTVNTYGFDISPHINCIIYDFFKFLEVAGYSNEIISEAFNEVVTLSEEDGMDF